MAATLRTHRPGDLGWMLERHAVLYCAGHGYLPVFERYVAASIVPFLDGFDPERDALWVAEQDGRRVGCIAIQDGAKEVPGWAKLRWFLVEPEARGQGVGRQLLEAAVAFARQAGYQGIFLWTVDDLAPARRLYEQAGFRLRHQAAEPCAWAPWGHEQEWRLAL